MSSEENSPLIPKLKGAPLAVMIALCGQQKPLTAVELQRKTGYSDKPISAALNVTLEPMDMVKKHGRMSGWSATRDGRITMIKQLMAKEAKEEKSLQQTSKHNLSTNSKDEKRNISDGSEKATDAGKKSETAAATRNNCASTARKMSERGSEKVRGHGSDQICSDIDQNEDIYKHQSDLIHSDLIQPSRKNEGSGPENRGLAVDQETKDDRGQGEREVLETILKQIEIEEPAFSEILARDKLVDVVAWYWYTLGKEKIQKPSGYVITCLKNKDQPPPESYRECARIWLTMSKDEYKDYNDVKHFPFRVEEYWRDWKLSKEEIKVFRRVKENGGLALFEDYERPILSNEEYTADKPRLRTQ